MAGKLVIFDCDGVLVASEELANGVLAEMLTDHGHPISAEESIQRFRGMSLTKCLETVEDETGITFPRSFETEIRQRMSSVFQVQLQPVEGATRLVESLRVPFCVASSGPRKKIEENLRTTNLYEHFHGKIFSAYDVGSWKPDPGLFLAAAKHFGVAPRNCVVIEDSYVGVCAGVAANMKVIALSTTEDDQPLAAAHRIFGSLADIHEFFVARNLSHK